MRVPYKWLLIGPSLAYAFGFAMNAIVMAANGGQMPVIGPLECVMRPAAIALGIAGPDPLHSCLAQSTHLKFLADWIVIRNLGVASPGDLLEWLYDATITPALAAWAALVIKDSN